MTLIKKIILVVSCIVACAVTARADRLRLGKGAYDATQKHKCTESLQTFTQLQFIIDHDPTFYISYASSGDAKDDMAIRYMADAPGQRRPPISANEFAGTTGWWDLPRGRSLVVRTDPTRGSSDGRSLWISISLIEHHDDGTVCFERWEGSAVHEVLR